MSRNVYKITKDWRFFRGEFSNGYDPLLNDSDWECVCLPHTVRVEPANCSGGKNYLGEAWYRRHFIADSNWEGKLVRLQIGGAKHICKVWINGILISEHKGGYIPFIVDLTEYLLWNQTNVIAIWMDNSDIEDIPPGKPQGGLDFCYFGGLYRDVELIVQSKLEITLPLRENLLASGGVFTHVNHADENSSELEIRTQIKNGYKNSVRVELKQLLIDSKGVAVAEEKINILLGAGENKQITQVLFMDNPNLWSPENPYLYKLKTILLQNNIIVDDTMCNIGIRTFAWHEDGFYLNKKRYFLSGANRHQEYVYLGDAMPDTLQRRDAIKLRKSGFTIIRTGHYPQSQAFMDACDEVGLMCIVPTPGWQHFLDTDVFQERSIEMTHQMIRWHRNHPCVVLWEPILNETWYTAKFAKLAHEAVHTEYPFPDAYDAADSHLAAAEIFDVLYAHEPQIGKPVITREYGDNWIEQYGTTETHFRNHRGIHGFYPGGEKGMLQSVKERAKVLDYKYAQKGVAGGCLWTGIDTNRGYIGNIAACGVMDLYRIPKFAREFYESQRPVTENAILYIASYWTEESALELMIFTNCERVELYLNGVKVDKEPTRPYAHLPNSPFLFSLSKFEEGELMAIGFVNGLQCAKTVCRTPGKAVKLICQIDDEGINTIANGADVVMIIVSAVDSFGTVDPNCYAKITATVEGEGVIVGDGDDRIGSNPISLEAGEIGILVSATRIAGLVTFQVQADGLQDGSCSFQTFQDVSKQLPGPDYPFMQHRIKQYKSDELVLFSAPMALAWDNCPNVASGCPVIASSFQEGQVPENITTPNYASFWTAESAQTSQWVCIDLEMIRKVSGVKILWASDNTNYTYRIEFSKDQKNFSEVFCGMATGQDQRVDLCEGETRFVRITVDKVSKGTASICSVEVLSL